MIIFHPAARRHQIQRGPFLIERMRPGLDWPAAEDPGFGPLGLVDHAVLGGGTCVPVHQHCDDEIFSYLRRGTLLHQDSLGRRESITPCCPMLMNSGSGLFHQESVPPGGETVEMLQVFVRPRASRLPPRLQVGHLASSRSENRWRLLAGAENEVNESSPPFFFRSAVEFYDAHLSDGATLQAPARCGFDLWFYVFDGAIVSGERTLLKGDAATFVGESPPTFHARVHSDLVCLLVNRTAPFTRAGTRSGSPAEAVSGRVILHSSAAEKRLE